MRKLAEGIVVTYAAMVSIMAIGYILCRIGDLNAAAMILYRGFCISLIPAVIMVAAKKIRQYSGL